MNRFVMNQQAKRFIKITFVFHPVNGIIGNQICDISVLPDGVVVLCNEIRIVVIALTGNYFPVVKSGRKAFKMPFAYQCGLISGFLQQFGECLLSTIEYTSGVIIEFVGTTVLARYHAGTAGSAQRISLKAVGKEYSFFRYAVKIGSFHISGIIATHHLCCMIIGHDIDDVQWLLCSLFFYRSTTTSCSSQSGDRNYISILHFIYSLI